MPSWWRQRKERHQQVSRDADNLMALFGERACSAALARARHEDETGGDPSHWFAVRREIGRRVGKDVGLDTGARYLGQ
jgi:hypothetical protein